MYTILWHLAQTELSDYRSPQLFEAICRLYMALPCLPAAAQSLVTTIASPAHSIRTAPQVDDGVFEGARALGHSLARAISLHLEGKWATRLPKLFEIVDGCSPRERLGAVLLLNIGVFEI